MRAVKTGGYAKPVTAGRIEFGPVLEGSFFFLLEFETRSDRDSQQQMRLTLERALGTEAAASLGRRLKDLTKRGRVELLTYRPDLSKEVEPAIVH